MVKRFGYIILGVLIFGFISCKKANERACLKSEGGESTREVILSGTIDSLYLDDNLYYELIPSNESKVELIGGENLIPFIEVEEGTKKLTIQNKNKCNFLRSFDTKIQAKIYVDNVTFIQYKGSSELKSRDTLFSNELRLAVKDGAGDVVLTVVNGYTSAVITGGYGNYTLKGRAISAFLNCSTNSYCNAFDFRAEENLIVYSNTVGEMLINADQTDLEVWIQQSGNVKYIGNPNSVKLEKTGSGELIKIN